MVSLGKELRKARIDKSMSQQELSASTGISQKHISALECDQMMPKWPTIATLSQELGIDLNILAREWLHLQQEEVSHA